MIEYHNVSLKFNNKTLVTNFNLKIEKGQKYLFKARSGKGKTTLAKLPLGFIKPFAGSIIIKEMILNKSNLKKIRGMIGYVSQDIELKKKTVNELIKEIFEYKINRRVKPSEEDIFELFDHFELNRDVLLKEVPLLSGGQRQRLGLIICILLNREIWILDEITSALDKELKQKVVDYVLNSNNTVIVISHDECWLDNSIIKVKEW